MDFVNRVLVDAGVTKEDPQWGLQYNMCYAAMCSGMSCAGAYDRVIFVLESLGITSRLHDTELEGRVP